MFEKTKNILMFKKTKNNVWEYVEYLNVCEDEE